MSKKIKFKNNIFLDSSSIMYERTPIKNIIKSYQDRNILEFKTKTSNNFNDYYNPGIYSIAGYNISNAPYTGNIYGVLVVITNDGKTWRKTDNGSWMWQLLFTTGGSVYLRLGINGEQPEGWRQLH